MRPRTEPDNAETQRREYSNINQCINHGSLNASDDHHSLALLIGGLPVAQPCSDLAQAGL
jgi:hypothetical protein